MSVEARQLLVNHPHTIFQSQSQRDDLLDPTKTQTGLIALLQDLIAKGFIILFTAVKSDHHDDSALGEHCHFNGYCADVWPLKSTNATDYLDATDPKFDLFLKVASSNQYLYQIGLAGSADIPACRSSAGSTCFSDDGGDHVHLGSQNEPRT